MNNTTDNNIIKEVLRLIGWNQEQHNEYVYAVAEAYLSGFIPSYPQIQTQIMKSPIFWNWWRSHWEKRDMQFIDQCYGWDEGQDARIEVYREQHDPRALLTAVYLNGQVLEESYAEMIGRLTDSQIRKHKEVAA
ncbi:MAG: hypothetical protein ABL876_14330 [Chitinophagaceae bacterium]